MCILSAIVLLMCLFCCAMLLFTFSWKLGMNYRSSSRMLPQTFSSRFSKHCYAAALVEQLFDFRLLSTGNVNLQPKHLVDNWSFFPGITSISVFLLFHKHYSLEFCLFCHPSVAVFCYRKFITSKQNRGATKVSRKLLQLTHYRAYS